VGADSLDVNDLLAIVNERHDAVMVPSDVEYGEIADE
jgi:hypothetical protein